MDPNPYRMQGTVDPSTQPNWRARLAAKEAELARAQEGLSQDDHEELAARQREAELDSKILDTLRSKRDLLMSRSREAWETRLGASGKKVYLDALPIAERLDFFVVAANNEAHKAFIARINKKGAKVEDYPEIYLSYALGVVKQWTSHKNGEWVELDTSSTMSAASMDLRKFLEENSGVVTTIAQCASRLAGAHADDHKS